MATAQSASTRAAPQMGQEPQQRMRAYRACTHCRNRKTRCDLDARGGLPPCKRCLREHRECVLCPPIRTRRQRNGTTSVSNEAQQPPFGGDREEQPDVQSAASSWLPSPDSSCLFSSIPLPVGNRSRTIIETASPEQPSPTLNKAQDSRTTSLYSRLAVGNLQNTSDAVNFLAQIVDFPRVGGQLEPQAEVSQNEPRVADRKDTRTDSSRSFVGLGELKHSIDYKPLQDGLISCETLYELFESYEHNYHPFFPIVQRQAFDPQNLSQLSKDEPHLFSAIIAVASKTCQSNPGAYQVCYTHARQIMSSLAIEADADIEGVEAFLLLSQWACQWPPVDSATGTGGEDKVAWMYIGNALRLGYFLDLDRTTLAPDTHKDMSPSLARKRLIWAACYMCDRDVSVRLGKGFWSRGPGPMTVLHSQDFPSLQPTSDGDEDYATIFQANLELTQLFSNAHDVLYSRKGRNWIWILQGDYVKYIDDFRASIRDWQNTWGTLTCSSRLKTSLLINYEYLRLYVNAFAYQASVSRVMISEEASSEALYGPLPRISAAHPDARFVYEALDAAKSLLTTLNNFVDPQKDFRYMPSRYYLYIIHGAVFLFKALSTTSMTPIDKQGVRRMVNETIDRLQKASTDQNHIGARYARLLFLLWRKKTPQHAEPNNPQRTGAVRSTGGIFATQTPMQSPKTNYSAFSWLDLGAVGNFATQNSGNLENIDVDLEQSIGEFDTASDMGLFADYMWLSEDNSNMLF